MRNDISKAIKGLSKELIPIHNSLEQQRELTKEVLQSPRVTAATVNLIIGGSILALFMGVLLGILLDIFSRLSETLGSPEQVFKISISSSTAVLICSLHVYVILKLTVQSIIK